jgi:GAF domain-containing protein
VDPTAGPHDGSSSEPDRAPGQGPQTVAAKIGAPGADPALALAIITEITDSIRGGLELNQVLGAILEGIARSGGFDVVVLSLLDRDRRRLVARLGYGEGVASQLDRLSVALQPGAGLLAETVLARTPSIVAAGDARQLVPPGARLPVLPATAFALEPFAVRDRPIGVILAGRTSPPAVGPSDAALLRLFANLTCIALAESGARAPE